MRLVLRQWIALLVLVAARVSAFAAEPARDEQLARIERAISTGTAFLAKQQEADGSWRSKTYGLLKDGTSLTPLAAWAISDEGEGRVTRDRALKRMSSWFVGEGRHARLASELQYPVYAAGLCLSTMHRGDVEANPEQIVAWTELIRLLQLNDRNGWSPDDGQYGGWGYSHEPPRKPGPGESLSPLDEPNLSATVFALEGLVASDPEGRSIRDARRAALIFVSHCQNLRTHESAGLMLRNPKRERGSTAAQDREESLAHAAGYFLKPSFTERESLDDARFNDGGFHFIQHDPVRNKPGVAGIDSRGETRFVSYGSATADGLRALLLCGVEPTDPRVVAARQWLLAHFEDGAHPGAYSSDRSSLKPSLDYYYAASVARAFSMDHAFPGDSAPQRTFVRDDESLGRAEWARRLSHRLTSRQREDGAWSNPAVDVREDDPFVATPLALRALQLCRDELRRVATHER